MQSNTLHEDKVVVPLNLAWPLQMWFTCMHLSSWTCRWLIVLVSNAAFWKIREFQSCLSMQHLSRCILYSSSLWQYQLEEARKWWPLCRGCPHFQLALMCRHQLIACQFSSTTSTHSTPLQSEQQAEYCRTDCVTYYNLIDIPVPEKYTAQ